MSAAAEPVRAELRLPGNRRFPRQLCLELSHGLLTVAIHPQSGNSIPPMIAFAAATAEKCRVLINGRRNSLWVGNEACFDLSDDELTEIRKHFTIRETQR